MKKPKFVTAAEAVDLIQDDSTLGVIAMTQISACEMILKEIENRFQECGHPKNLTYLHSCGQASMNLPGGMQHLAHEGLIKRVFGGHWGQSDKMMALISQNKIEAYNLPQGQMANMYHSMALCEPGKISKVGLDTYIDPRYEGGKMNQKTKDCGYDEVNLIKIDGEEYLQYKPIKIDTLLIRGTYADENGNISTANEGMILEVLPAVMATRRWCGKVICQVEKVVKAGTINPKEVAVPGVLIDAIVVCDDPYTNHRQTYSWYFDPSFSGQTQSPVQASEPIPLNARKVIGRRAMMELLPDQIINIGTGIPNDVVGSIMTEEDVTDDIMVTVESGIYGGIPQKTIDFGISMNAQALIPHDRQFELYNGAGIDFTFMGAGELDEYGNVNATKMGMKAPGAGGFIDITATAKNVIFCSSFTGGGLKTSFGDDGVKIEKEGTFKKLVKKVQQVSYNGKNAIKNGQNMVYITERAVFRLTPQGVMLVEVAKGVDIQKNILDQMEFKPLIANDLKITDTSIYKDGAFGLKKIIEKKSST